MKNNFWLVLVCLVAFIAGYSINSKAISDTGYRVAVVDVQQLVGKSSQLTFLKQDQQKKLADMQKTVEQAKQEMAKETDPVKIAQIEEKYRNQINNQKLALDKEYNTKLKQIDTDIKTITISKAKEMKYNLVLPKNIVLFGGDDITNEVAKSIK